MGDNLGMSITFIMPGNERFSGYRLIEGVAGPFEINVACPVGSVLRDAQPGQTVVATTPAGTELAVVVEAVE